MVCFANALNTRTMNTVTTQHLAKNTAEESTSVGGKIANKFGGNPVPGKSTDCLSTFQSRWCLQRVCKQMSLFAGSRDSTISTYNDGPQLLYFGTLGSSSLPDFRPIYCTNIVSRGWYYSSSSVQYTGLQPIRCSAILDAGDDIIV